MSKKTLIALATALLGTTMAVQAAEINYTYSDNDQYKLWGAKIAQNYDVAIYLPASAFAGNQVTSVMVPVVESDNIVDYTVWLSTELTLETVDGKKVNVPDVTSIEVTPEGFVDEMGYINCTLPEAYTITDKGVYVGYSFTVSKLSSDLDRYPVVCTTPGVADAFWVHTSKTYRTWADRAIEGGIVSPIRVTLAGDFYANAVGIDPVGNIITSTDTPATPSVTIRNFGSAPVASVEYAVTAGGKTQTGVCEFASPIPAVYNYATQINVETPALPNGVYDCEIAITKVNGEANGRHAVATTKISVLDMVPVKRPLMEEFTGTWCGWCPRGWMAMEKMHEFHPDFVCISYHNGDQMQLAQNYPDMADGFPMALMDRTISCDPYYGTNEKEMGIETLWKQLGEQFTEAAITAEAKYDGENTVTVTSEVFWAADGSGEYRMAYVLTGDNMSDEKWVQGNYYTRYAQGKGGIYMDPFCKGGEWGQDYVSGLKFSDVALLSTPTLGIEESVSTTAAGEHSVYSYTFNLADNPLIAKAESLHVVAILVKNAGKFGTVVNCDIAEVTNTSSITVMTVDAVVESVKYYDLSGRELQHPRGIAIKSVKYSDGRVINSKVVR